MSRRPVEEIVCDIEEANRLYQMARTSELNAKQHLMELQDEYRRTIKELESRVPKFPVPLEPGIPAGFSGRHRH
jgi:hypothetical protein